MPQTGADLVSAGYPISRPLTALLGGTTNLAQPNVPIATNLDYGFGGLTDVAAPGSAASGSVYSVAVPISPGAVITKISWVVGNTSAASTNVTNLWSGLYTGTGSAPGTAGAAPVLIANAPVTGSVNVASASLLTFTFSTPQTITALQAPYGYIYASYSITSATGAGSPTTYGPSLISMTSAASATKGWYSTSPVAAFLTSNGGTASSVPATIGTNAVVANPPIVLLY